MMKRLGLLIALAAACLVLLPAQAQDGEADGNGRGVVRMADPYGECLTGSCAPLVSLLLPRLFEVDPVTGTLLDADSSGKALARIVPTSLPADTVTLELADRQWSDGLPVTAYDVLYTLMVKRLDETSMKLPQVVIGAQIIDDKHIALRFTPTDDEAAKLPRDTPPATATCDALPRANQYVRPYHAYVEDFRSFVDNHAPEGNLPSLDAWWDAYRNAEMPYPYAMTDLTSGSYRYVDDGQFVPVDGTGAVILSVSAAPNRIDKFIAGETNLLFNIPESERPKLRLLADANRGNVQIAEVPGRESLIILLNLGNPKRPLPGIHPETGEGLDQGTNPLFSNPAVRRALQLAIDPPALIDGVIQRSAQPLAGLYLPSSWAFDPSLPLPETNVQEAQRLLDEAGWRMHSSTRTCQGCQTTEDGTPLQVSLGTSGLDRAVANQIVSQWARIGVQAFVSIEDNSRLAAQTFDAYLARVGGSPYEAADPDRTLMLTPAGDVVDPAKMPPGVFLNYGSYNNPDVTALLAEARTIPGCDTGARAIIYHQVERILQQDLPFLSVAAPTEFYAAAPDVLGFAPRTGDPLWNVESWIVASAPNVSVPDATEEATP